MRIELSIILVASADSWTCAPSYSHSASITYHAIGPIGYTVNWSLLWRGEATLGQPNERGGGVRTKEETAETYLCDALRNKN